MWQQINKIKFIILLISAFSFFSCGKEEIYSNELFGTWTFSEVQLLGNQKDSTLALSGTFEFRKSSEIGASGFGELAEAEADIPYWALSGMTLRRKIIYIGKPNEPANYNFKNAFHGYYADKVSGNAYLSIPLDMMMPSRNELRILLGNDNLLTNKQFPTFFLRLTRK